MSSPFDDHGPRIPALENAREIELLDQLTSGGGLPNGSSSLNRDPMPHELMRSFLKRRPVVRQAPGIGAELKDLAITPNSANGPWRGLRPFSHIALDIILIRCRMALDMDTIQRTIVILNSAEKALATLATDAAKAGDYDAAGSLIELARVVNGLGASARQRMDLSRAERPAEAPARADETPMLPEVTRAPQPRGGPKKGTYPIFLREGDNLVKVGWSPSDKTEYEHKSPKKVLPHLAAAITKAGANGKRFSMARVLPLVDPVDGAAVPDYQAYLCLAWFRALGFLVQHGRKGYSLASKAPVGPLIETHWASLPSR